MLSISRNPHKALLVLHPHLTDGDGGHTVLVPRQGEGGGDDPPVPAQRDVPTVPGLRLGLLQRGVVVQDYSKQPTLIISAFPQMLQSISLSNCSMLEMNWSPLTPPMMVGRPYTRLKVCSVRATY